jgi:STE24 endopeptidase
MNFYGIIIISALLVDFLLSLIANLLNLSRLQPQVPTEFQGVYDENKYQNSQRYTRVNTRFRLLVSTVDLLLLLFFWLLGGFNWLNHQVEALHFSMILSGLLYLGILIFAKSVLSLPFDIYATFVIEERFGFNKTTPLTFIMDRLKGALLGIIIGAPLFALVLYLFAALGAWAWLGGWAAVSLLSIILQYITPMLILPLFNKFQPLSDGELKTAIFSFASSAGFPLAGVFVIDGSKRSSKSNAYFTGFGKKKRIALFDTLLQQHTVAEVVAVLAHEIGHSKLKHILLNLVLSTIHSGILFFLLSLFLHHQPLYHAFFMDSTPIYAGMLFFGLLYSPIEMLLAVGLHALSRKNEFQADHYAAVMTQAPEALVSALKKLSVNNLSNLTPHPFYVFFNYSHPPILERIKALKAFEKPSEAG